MTINSDTESYAAPETALLLFDVLENAREKIEERGVLDPVLRLVEGCRKRNVPIFSTRPMHRADGADFARCLPDMDRDEVRFSASHPHPTRPTYNAAGTHGAMPLSDLGLSSDDYDITKHRWSAFHGTSLDLSLRTRGIRNVLIVGGTTHIGVASTVYAGRDLDYQMVVVRDGCHGEPRELACFLDLIFPKICSVRTVDEVIDRLR